MKSFRAFLPVRWWVCISAWIALLIAHRMSYGTDIQDALTLRSVNDFHLHYPMIHILFEPIFGVADAMTLSVAWTALIFVIWALILIMFVSGWKRRGILLMGTILFFLWVAMVPRPMAWITADDPDMLIVDFHSHTSLSHDGRSSFSCEANSRWHQQQGFNAGFITDHNLITAAQACQQQSSSKWIPSGYSSLVGEEVSLYKMHFVVLGPTEKINNKQFDFPNTSNFIPDMHKKNLLVVGVLPYYWLHHWNLSPMFHPDKDVPSVTDFIQSGVDGFEISNGAPRGLDFLQSERRDIVDLCRKNNRLLTGVSDNHGYGYATPSWSAVRLPGWKSLTPDQLQQALLHHLREKGFSSVRVLERPRYRPETPLELSLSPFGILAVYARSLLPSQIISWFVWIWGVTALSFVPPVKTRGLNR